MKLPSRAAWNPIGYARELGFVAETGNRFFTKLILLTVLSSP